MNVISFAKLELIKFMADPTPDIEKRMLRGCFYYVLLSLGGFAIEIWPFFIWTHHYALAELGLCVGLGLAPFLLLGFWLIRREGIPAAAGAIGCALATSVFLYLRILQMVIAAHAEQVPPLDYPDAFVWLIPTGWIILVALTGAIAMSLSPNQDQADTGKPSA